MKQEKSIIIFDGVCCLCNKFILFVIRRDYKDQFRFISMQNPNLHKYVPNINRLDSARLDSILLVNRGGIKSKSEAVRDILFHLQGYSVVATLMRLSPKKISDVLYSIVAKYRYKLFGTAESCSIIEQKINRELFKKKMLF